MPVMQFAPLYPWLHQVLKPAFPDCLWTGASDVKAIALTFDDGPHAAHTPRLLKVLERYEITASFFFLGACVNRCPDVVRASYQQGHWLGLHGYDHQLFPRLSALDLNHQLAQTQEAIARACQLDLSYVQQQVRDVRPPYGVVTPQTLRYLDQWGYRPVMWSVVPEDWVQPGVGVAAGRVLNQTQNGSLIVLHDGYCGGKDVAAIADAIIPRLLKQGYQFVTVDQFWHMKSIDRL